MKGAFKPETIRKFLDDMKNMIAQFRDNDNNDLNVVITTGNKKIGKVMNVSLAPVLTCPNCGECSKHCYDVSAALLRPNVRRARAINTYLAMYRRHEYFAGIIGRLSRARVCRCFRWHVGGEIPDIDYFTWMCRIAEMFPEWRFWTYTKNYSVINEYVKRNGNDRHTAIPANLSIMFSLWNGMPMNNPYDFPVFACEMPGFSYPDIEHICPGNCSACIAGHTGCPFGVSGKVALH